MQPLGSHSATAPYHPAAPATIARQSLQAPLTPAAVTSVQQLRELRMSADSAGRVGITAAECNGEELPAHYKEVGRLCSHGHTLQWG